MAQPKGSTGNPSGRPKGATNKVTTDLRKAVNNFLNKNWKTVQKDFDQMEPRERLAFLDKMLSYSLPKLQAVQVEADVNTTLNKIEALHPEQANEIFDKLMNVQ